MMKIEEVCHNSFEHKSINDRTKRDKVQKYENMLCILVIKTKLLGMCTNKFKSDICMTAS